MITDTELERIERLAEPGSITLRVLISSVRELRARAEAAEAENERLRGALEPFARVAEHDIGADEDDTDTFWPMSNARYSMSGRLRVGHLRAARLALENTNE